MKQKWFSNYATVYDKPYTAEYKHIADRIKDNILKLQNKTPLISVVIIAHNEGRNLLSCLWSVSDMKCRYPVEIIGVDNDSTDNTVQLFHDCGIEPYLETEYHSAGAARQKGLEHCIGKYYVCMDGDTMYPIGYVENMVTIMEKDTSIAAVDALWNFLPHKGHSSIGMLFYRLFRNIHLYIQSIKRPELAVRGMTLAFVTELGRKFGFRKDISRGEDGSLVLKLKNVGSIKFSRSSKTRVMTGYRTLNEDGTLSGAFWKRVWLHISHFSEYFTSTDHYEDKKPDEKK